MKATNEFVANLNDVFAPFGEIQAKRMFGGYGIYHNGLMFALVFDDVLYLKSDENSAASFIELGLQKFEYEKSGKKVRMSFYAAPEEVFDDDEKAKEWGGRAYEAALRSKKSKTSRGKRK